MKRAWAIAIVMALATLSVVPSVASEGDDIPLPSRMRKSQKAGGKGLPNGKPLLRGGGDVTRCSACHLVEGWEKVRFNHDPTGFPLRGAHVTVACGSCHPRGFDVQSRTPALAAIAIVTAASSASCAKGATTTRAGRRCFRLMHTGGPASPHRQARPHSLPAMPRQHARSHFRQRAARLRLGHQANYNRTKVTSIDHGAAGFSLECQTCHNTWRFWPARLPQHDACFRLTSGPHNGIRCLGCHTSLPPPTFTGACAVDTLNCTGCHAHECARSNAEHNNPANPALALYQCVNDRCYECHVNDLR